MDRFENMRTFTRVVEAGSISGAAELMGVAKSAVSRRLKELEEHLGVELFHRTTRRMNLTDTGRAFYQQSVRILEDVLEAELATSQAHSTLKGSLKVTLPSSFGLMHMGPAINEFLQIHPLIKFDLDFNDRQVDLMQEGFDLAIRIANLPDSSLIARCITPILNEYHPRQFDAYAVYPQTRHLSQRVRAFVDFLVKRFEGIPYWDS